VSSQTPEFIRGVHNLRPRHRGAVVTIGTFDGVHRGHQAILTQVQKLARQYELPSMAVVFEPQPHEYFSRQQAPARLMRLSEKVQTLFAAGVNRVLCLPFNAALITLTAEAFVQQVLVEGLGVRHLVVGDDFRFGCDRRGDFAMLQALGEQWGFEVSDTCTLTDGGQRISSTRIRQLLEQGKLADAERLLGRPYCISGRVGHGRQLGRTLGVPTANVQLPLQRLPLAGVYVTRVEVDGHWYPGVANVGTRPTVNADKRPLLEVHLLDFDRDLYGQRLRVCFLQKLRDEQRFASLPDLQAQLQVDIQQARDILSVRSFKWDALRSRHDRL